MREVPLDAATFFLDEEDVVDGDLNPVRVVLEFEEERDGDVREELERVEELLRELELLDVLVREEPLGAIRLLALRLLLLELELTVLRIAT